jgi:Mg2+-importing ATPase
LRLVAIPVDRGRRRIHLSPSRAPIDAAGLRPLRNLVIALVVRTRRRAWQSRPGALLLWSTLTVIALTFAIPYLPHAGVLGFTPMPPGVVTALVAIAALYACGAERLKTGFYRLEERRIQPARA